MRSGPAYGTAALLAASTACAADLPDQSERFREAMSACTLAGPGIEARLERLATTGWSAARPDAADAAAFRDAALLDASPAPEPDAWRARRAAGPIALPETVHRNGSARLLVFEDRESGRPACRLATLNSRDSDALFDDLEGAGAVTETGPVRRAEMATTLLDDGPVRWVTEVRLSSADTDRANALLDEPLAATLAVSFLSRPAE